MECSKQLFFGDLCFACRAQARKIFWDAELVECLQSRILLSLVANFSTSILLTNIFNSRSSNEGALEELGEDTKIGMSIASWEHEFMIDITR